MGYSFYEVYITAQRAFRGMGFPFGADEDAAFIITWLELNNLKGIEVFNNLINQLDQKYDGTINIENINNAIDFNNQSILMKGSGLIDYMLSTLDHKKNVTITVKNCSNGILFLPLLYKASHNIKFSEIIFSNKKNENYIYKVTKDGIFFKTETKKEIKINQVKISLNNNLETSSNNLVKKIITEKIIQQNLSLSLTPQEHHWDAISSIANRTFVPESKESRNKGAGGGDAND